MLFFANKADILNHAQPNEIEDTLDLKELIKDRKYWIVPSNGITGEGIEDGLKWLNI